MKAVVVRQFGDPSVLRYEEIEAPLPGPGEVLIRVHAAGTNPVDAGNRADGSWAEVSLPWVPGYELAGVIQAVGPGAGPAGTGLVPGQRVLAMTGFRRQGGGYAEFAVVAASQVVVLADSVSFIDAAATPLAGGTAWQVLTRLSLQPGERLLVLGASGGVGSFLLQLAARSGIKITAVGRREHHRRMLRLGASSCVDYTEGGAPASVAEGSVDAIADLAGGPGIKSWLAAVRPFGQLASIAEPELDLGQLVDENLTFHGVLWAPSGQTAAGPGGPAGRWPDHRQHLPRAAARTGSTGAPAAGDRARWRQDRAQRGRVDPRRARPAPTSPAACFGYSQPRKDGSRCCAGICVR